jgi:hypothetical protein
MKQAFEVREGAAAWTVSGYLSSVVFVLVSRLRGELVNPYRHVG